MAKIQTVMFSVNHHINGKNFVPPDVTSIFIHSTIPYSPKKSRSRRFINNVTYITRIARMNCYFSRLKINTARITDLKFSAYRGTFFVNTALSIFKCNASHIHSSHHSIKLTAWVFAYQCLVVVNLVLRIDINNTYTAFTLALFAIVVHILLSISRPRVSEHHHCFI